jgi:hypothetical protein
LLASLVRGKQAGPPKATEAKPKTASKRDMVLIACPDPGPRPLRTLVSAPDRPKPVMKTLFYPQ